MNQEPSPPSGASSLPNDPTPGPLPFFLSPEYRKAAQAVGSFIEFWGFKRIHGILWFLLYTSPRPLSQQELGRYTGFSKASISLALREMEGWGVIHLLPGQKGRERFYEPETHLGTMVRNVLERRERRMLEEAERSFQELLHALRARSPRVPFMERRVENLLLLTRTALFVVKEFLYHSRISLSKIRGYFLKDLG